MPEQERAPGGRMRGRVISGQLIEELLAQVPEELWFFDVAIEGADNSTADLPVMVPTRRRHEIVAQVLALASQLD